MGFKVGDKVRWVSEAIGSAREKRGVVCAVVPAGSLGVNYAPIELRRAFEGWTRRSHESYIVNVDGVAYWPRVKWLRPDL